jgi:glycosyltransferase involved in cell wall biosynthesis
VKKILCLFDYYARTGFGTVSKNIVKELRKSNSNYKLDIVAINYFGENIQEDENTNIFSARLNDVNEDAFGRHVFLKMLQDGDYDGVFINQDLGVIVPIIEIITHIKQKRKEENKKSFKTIFYFPIDCSIVWELTKNLEQIDLLVTYTNFAKDEILKHKPELRTKIKVIPHGNNSKEFHPINVDESYSFRKTYFGDNADKFIITNVNRNQSRKDIPNTIFGFVEAKKMWNSALPEPFLYLHCHPKDPQGWDLRAIFEQLNLVEDEDYMLLPKKYEDELVEVSVLNRIYNASDVYLTTTLGEGWGLGFSEAASCQLPIIAPFSTSFMEMSNYGENAYMLLQLYPYCNTTDNVIREQTDIYEIADTILNVAIQKNGGNPELYKKINSAYNWVKKLEWSDICKNWIDHFKSTY